MTRKTESPWPAILRKLRAERGWTQAETAELAGVPLRTFIAWENAQYKPRKLTASRLRKLFDLPIANR